MKIKRYIRVLPSDGPLDELYRKLGTAYPKYFKMDVLCRLGFVSSELLLRDEPGRFVEREDRAVLLFSRHGPLCNDRNFMATIRKEDFFPSPSLFVYTLANIVTGEIAIRNRYQGDTTAYGLLAFDASEIVKTVEAAFLDRVTSSAVCGWVDCEDKNNYESVLMLVEKDGEGLAFDEDNVNRIYEYGRID